MIRFFVCLVLVLWALCVIAFYIGRLTAAYWAYAQ